MDDNQAQVEETTVQSSSESNNDALMLLKIEEMVKTHLAQIDSLQEEITKRKDMLDDILANDETYQEHEKLAKEAARIKSNTKKEILKRADAKELSDKLKELKSEKKDLQTGLSDYLKEYQRLSGTNEIEGDDGEIREIVYTAKLVKRSSKF